MLVQRSMRPVTPAPVHRYWRRPAAAGETARDRLRAAPQTWSALLQISIHAYYRGDLALGRAACEGLLSIDGLPNDVAWQGRRNQVFYSERLQDLVPSCSISAIRFPVPERWSRFNPSIAAGPDGYAMIVRSSNYEMDGARYRVFDDDQVIRTTNYLLTLRPDLSVASVTAIDDRPGKGRTYPFPVSGFEDCRLFHHGGCWRVSATTREHNPQGICQMALLRLADGAFGDLRLLSPAGRRHEKNWTPLSVGGELLFIYSFRPTIILRYIEAQGGVGVAAQAAGPKIAENFRGGSPAVAVAGGFLCLIHEPVPFEDGTRVYQHRLVRLDRNFTVTHISPQFYFLERGVEYGAGLTVCGSRLIVSFGFRDREAYLASMDLDQALTCLRSVG
jgi:predicted GH43/DUF377 family glycosyl hydrolase